MTSKADLVSHISTLTGEPAANVKPIVDAVFNGMANALIVGVDVKVAGFGTFAVKATKARVGRNPKTGEAIAIPAGKKVTFKPSPELKGKI